MEIAELKTAAAELYTRLDKAFTVMDCKKALYSTEGDLEAAAVWLTNGNWAAAKLVSWNWEGLRESADALHKELGVPEPFVMKVLKDCGGHRELARRKLMFQPLLLPVEN